MIVDGRENILDFIEGSERPDLMQTFLANVDSNVGSMFTGFPLFEGIIASMRSSNRVYVGAHTVALPAPEDLSKRRFLDVLRDRKTERRFSGCPMMLADVSTLMLLCDACSVADTRFWGKCSDLPIGWGAVSRRGLPYGPQRQRP